jgi:hypothetical protein
MFRAILAYLQEAVHKKALGIVRARYVSWLHQDWSGTGVPRDTSSTPVHKDIVLTCGEQNIFCQKLIPI